MESLIKSIFHITGITQIGITEWKGSEWKEFIMKKKDSETLLAITGITQNGKTPNEKTKKHF
jgi:hypothetical protein